MVEINDIDIEMAFDKLIKINTFNKARECFFNNKRSEIYSFILDVITTHVKMGCNNEYITLMASEIVYYLWKIHYENQKFIEEIFGKKNIDYSAINDDVVELASVNLIDQVGRNWDKETICKMVDMKKERVNKHIGENRLFFNMVWSLTAKYFQGDPLWGSVLAFLSIEECMKRENMGFKLNPFPKNED